MPQPDTFLYFAYGSNLKLEEIRRTCPSAEPVCRALLPGHHLTFPRGSIGRGCGVAGVESADGHIVWGGVYRIAEQCRTELERREGFKSERPASENSYVANAVTVFDDGDLSRPIEVLTFAATRQPNPPKPSAEYVQLILDGAKEWKLGDDYLAELERIETTQQ